MTDAVYIDGDTYKAQQSSAHGLDTPVLMAAPRALLLQNEIIASGLKPDLSLICP